MSRLLTELPHRHVWLFYGHAVGEHPEALEWALALKDQHLSRFSLGVVVDREPDEAELLSGRLDRPKIQALASRMFDAKTVDEYLVWGGDTLAADVRSALGSLGVDASRIRFEQLDGARAVHATGEAASSRAAAHSVASSALAAPTADETLVSFVMDGRRRSFPMRRGANRFWMRPAARASSCRFPARPACARPVARSSCAVKWR